MKHSQLIGIIAVLALIGICFVPWSFIPSKNIVITGFQSAGTDFGRPGYLNIILSTVCLLFFAIPKIWAKRANVFIAAINLAWAIRNYFIISMCREGDCPEKQIGLWLVLLASILILIAALFPDIQLKEEKK